MSRDRQYLSIWEIPVENVSVRAGHLINSGEMFPRDCPEENIRAYVETIHETWKDAS